METDVYVKLGERMNEFEGRYPLVDAYIKVLQEMCTEEEADFAAKFPDKAYTVDELCKLYQKDKSELVPLLDTMTWKGLFYTEKKRCRRPHLLLESHCTRRHGILCSEATGQA